MNSTKKFRRLFRELNEIRKQNDIIISEFRRIYYPENKSIDSLIEKMKTTAEEMEKNMYVHSK